MTQGNDYVMVRIYFNEGDRSEKENLAKKLLSDLLDKHLVAGATLQRALAGFGSHGVVHEATILHPEARLPLILEFFDSSANVSRALEYILTFSGVTAISWPISTY